jgi:hypothetical protein
LSARPILFGPVLQYVDKRIIGETQAVDRCMPAGASMTDSNAGGSATGSLQGT